MFSVTSQCLEKVTAVNRGSRFFLETQCSNFLWWNRHWQQNNVMVTSRKQKLTGEINKETNFADL